ncbi:MAG TPA: hypothetical protein VE954_26990 [Oligoflexus sp.]|uniref:hypothetical protein n=1 Tax=Oligoflexus sp. TaxID=1971216 RepID=UPI002D688439|nr:hypothetical protein [Oligoflexus sp.]HYX36771.1 hypothetical protein [Oligoflexus sp.]
MLRIFSLIVVAFSFVPQVYALDFKDISIHGYSSFEVERQISEKGSGDTNNSFDMDLFDVVLNFQLSDRVRVAADLTWEHGTATEDGTGNAAVEYAFTEITYTDAVKLRFGKFLLPFGYFNEIHTAKPSTLSVKEAASTNKTERLAKNGERFFPRWGAGMGLKGSMASAGLDYDILVTNGEQDEEGNSGNPYEKDNNLSKALTARVHYRPSTGLLVSPSYYKDQMSADVKDMEHSVTSYGLYLNYSFFDANVIAEFVEGKFVKVEIDEDAAEKDKNNWTQQGWFIQLAYAIDATTPYLRYELINPDVDIKKDVGTDTIIGVNHEIDDGLFGKLEYHMYGGEFDDSHWTEVKLALVAGW